MQNAAISSCFAPKFPDTCWTTDVSIPDVSEIVPGFEFSFYSFFSNRHKIKNLYVMRQREH